MKTEKIITATVIAVLLAAAPVTHTSAQDFIVIEALIENHKVLSDKMAERNKLETGLLGTAVMNKQETEQYHTVLDQLKKRFSGAFSNLTFAADVANLTTLGYKAIQSMENAVSEGIKMSVQFPMLMPVGTEMLSLIGDQIEDIVKLGGMVLSNGTGVVLATNEERTQFTFMMREKIERIKALADNYNELCFFLRVFGINDKETTNEVYRELSGQKVLEKYYELLKE